MFNNELSISPIYRVQIEIYSFLRRKTLLLALGRVNYPQAETLNSFD